MPKVFLSHKFQEKQVAKDLKKHLSSCFITAWLDEDNLPGGRITTQIQKAIEENPIFIALISERYLDSVRCMEEFEHACDLRLRKKVRIVPVVLGDRAKICRLAEEKGLREVFKAIDSELCIVYQEYEPELSFKRIKKMIVDSDAIWFEPIRIEKIQGVDIQIIEMKTMEGRIAPEPTMKDWDYDLEAFLADSPSDNTKPIKFGIPVGFYNSRINWVTAAISTPFKNRRTLFIFNHPDGYICAYPFEAKFKGMVLLPTSTS